MPIDRCYYKLYWLLGARSHDNEARIVYSMCSVCIVHSETSCALACLFALNMRLRKMVLMGGWCMRRPAAKPTSSSPKPAAVCVQ